MTHPFNSDSVKAKMIGFPRHRRNQAGNAGWVILLLIAAVVIIVGANLDHKQSGQEGSSGTNNPVWTPVPTRTPTPPPPTLPLTISQRGALLTTGKVVIFGNTGTQTLSLVVKFENPTFKRTKRIALVLSPRQSEEIGSLEGWDGVPGERVTVVSDGFSSASYVIKE